MIAYLDTNVILWLAEGSLHHITPEARQVLEKAKLFVSPMVLVELQFLYEVNRISLPPKDVLAKLSQAVDVQVCPLPFPKVADAALNESWTREPFDRLITAQAKANSFATLITADSKIRANYAAAIW